MGKLGISELRQNKNEIISRYVGGNSTYKIAQEYNTFPEQINILLRENKISLRPANIKNDIELSGEFREILDGWLLGDGHLASSGIQAKFCLSSKHEEYVNYAASLFEKNGMKSKIYNHTQFNKVYYRVHSQGTMQLGELHRKWYIKKKKIVPKDIKLKPDLIKYWIMDDGTYSKTSGHLRLCTNGFTMEECDELAYKLNQYLNTTNIHTIERGENTTRIYLPKVSVNLLYNRIGPLPVKCFHYKMPCIKGIKT